MDDMPPQFGVAYSLNITQHPQKGIGSWTDGEIAYLLRTGIARDGRYTPPWMVKLPRASDEEIASIIAFLRSDDPLVQASDVEDIPSRPTFFAKFLCREIYQTGVDVSDDYPEILDLSDALHQLLDDVVQLGGPQARQWLFASGFGGDDLG